MDEDEYDEYLNQIDEIDPLLIARARSAEGDPMDDFPLYDRLRDKDGSTVPGCYRLRPCNVLDEY